MDYIYNNLVSSEEIEALQRDPVCPLVRELHFKYGLKVIAYDKSESYGEWIATMSRDDGLPICAAWRDGEEFNLHTPFYRKARGSSENDRHTLRSGKLSSLMATLKKNNVIPNDEQVRASAFEYNIQQGMNMIRKSIVGEASKSVYDINTKDLHGLLKSFFGEKDVAVNVEKCKEVLDKYNEADRLNDEREREILSFFNKEFYVVGSNQSNHLVIGALQCVGDIKDMVVNVTRPLKRMRSLDECEYGEVKAAMLMTKVVFEDKKEQRMFGNGLIPYLDKYDTDLGLIFSNRRVGKYDLAWTFIPCATTSVSTPPLSANTTPDHTE